MTDPGSIFDTSIDETVRVHQVVRREGRASVLKAAEAIRLALAEGRKVMTFGNGGSASDAQHVVAELVGRFRRERQALPAIALTVDTSILTAIGNDYSFDRIFARQVEALGAPGDVAIGISTSGRSANVIAAFEVARERGLTTIAMTGGDGGPMGQVADIHVNVPDRSTPRVQEVQRTLLHVICEIVEEGLATE